MSNSQLAIENVNFDEGRLVVHGDLDLQQSAQLSLGGVDQNYVTALEVGGNMRLHDTASLAVYGGPTNSMFDFATGTAVVRVGAPACARFGTTGGQCDLPMVRKPRPMAAPREVASGSPRDTSRSSRGVYCRHAVVPPTTTTRVVAAGASPLASS